MAVVTIQVILQKNSSAFNGAFNGIQENSYKVIVIQKKNL